MFEVRDLIELQVLQKALMVARFSGESPVLLGSPYLSILHTMIVDEIIARYRADTRLGDAARWVEWRQLSKDRREWIQVRRELSEPAAKWSAVADKADHLRTCFAPFEVSDELIDEMVMLLDQPSPGNLLIEEEDRWILPLAGASIVRCLVDWAITLQCDGEYEVRIEGPFIFRTPEGAVHELDPDEDPVGLGVVLSVARGRIVSAEAFKDGRLELLFTDGARIEVPVDASYEAWELAGPSGLRVVSLPGGELALWT
jgi:hypothetical protein